MEEDCSLIDLHLSVLSVKSVVEFPAMAVRVGGEDTGDWFLYPERPAILIGTQDMLLSRGLNRGYASPRARWPVEFGLLSQDALWVMDEVQLMDVGLATSAQLQAFRDQDEAKGLRPCRTWWMSATLQPDWLKTVDSALYHPEWTRQPCCIPATQRNGDLWEVSKSLSTDSMDPDDADGFAKRILAEHEATVASDFDRITLAVCNTVDRVCRTYSALARGPAGANAVSGCSNALDRAVLRSWNPCCEPPTFERRG